MPEHAFFYVIFLSQVLLISLYLPKRLLGRLRHIVARYPPSEYPKLYPVPLDTVERAQRNYRNLNSFALLVGLALVLAGVLAPTVEIFDWDSAVLTMYSAIQWSPFIIATTAGFTYFNLKRRPDSRSTRRADLHPRRLFDFVSPALVGAAILVYLAFVLLILYVRQFEFPWFGGHWNIFAMTAANLLFAGLIFKSLYGKRKDPYKAHEDRMREIELNANLLVWVSIVATLFVVIAVTLRALELPDVIPVAQSLYFQLLALISFRAFRIDHVNFEVYREDPSVA